MSKLLKALALAGAMISCTSASAWAQTPTPSGFVDVPGGKLWYETCGSGARTMVLIHDGVMHSVIWDDVWPTLCKSFHVVRYDRRGYGRSPEARAPYSQVDDLQAVMTAAGAKTATLVGASNGGGLVVDFSLAHPDEVDRLVLVAAAVSGLPPSRYFWERYTELLGRAARGDLMGAIKGSWLLAPGDDANAARLVKLEAASPHDMNHRDPAIPPPPAAGRLGEIKAPTLVLIGEYDEADNQGKAGILEYAIPGATRVVVKKAAHLIYMSQPAEFTDLVSRFAASDQAAAPATETTFRRAIDGLQQGTPDFAVFDPAGAANLRQQAGTIKGQLAPYGAIRTVISRGQAPDGAHIFLVAYDKGVLDWRVILGPDGKITTIFYKPLPPAGAQ